MILLILVAIKLPLKDEKKQYEKSEYIEFGYEKPNALTVMNYVTEGWKYKITQDGNVYYCTKKYGGKVLNEEYEKCKDEFDETFIKKIDNNTLQKIKEYIYEKLLESKEPFECNSYMRIMENGEWKTTRYDGTTYLKELIGE